MTPPDSPAWRLRGVTFAYGEAPHVLRGVDLEIPKGDLLGLVGPNGAGKSTLLRLLSGVLKPTSGRIEAGGVALGSIPRGEVARLVAVVPQAESASFAFTAEEVVLMGRAPHLKGFLAPETAADRAIAREALATVGMAAFASRPVGTLSGGERQLVLVARALAQQTPALLLDEPTAALDLAHQQQVLRLVAAHNRDCRVTAVLVVHDLNAAARTCKRIALLHEGRVELCGPPGEVLTEENLRRVYGADLWVGKDPEGLPLVGLRR